MQVVSGCQEDYISGPANRNGAFAFGNINTYCVVHDKYLHRLNLHGIQHSSLLIQSPGVSSGHALSSPTYVNRTAADDKLADWLSYGHLMVLGGRGHTNAYLSYSLNNERYKA